MNFIEVGARVKAYRQWSVDLLQKAESTSIVNGQIQISELDDNTLIFNTKTVDTIYKTLEDLKSNINSIAKNLPSLNYLDDINFQTTNWQLIGTGTITIEPVTDVDLQDLSNLSGVDLTKLNGVSQKIVIANLPQSTDPTVSRLIYSTTYTFVNGMFSIGGFCKINCTVWQYVTPDIVANPISDGNLYEVNLGTFTDFELFLPYVTLSNIFYGQ